MIRLKRDVFLGKRSLQRAKKTKPANITPIQQRKGEIKGDREIKGDILLKFLPKYKLLPAYKNTSCVNRKKENGQLTLMDMNENEFASACIRVHPRLKKHAPLRVKNLKRRGAENAEREEFKGDALL